MYDVLIIGAGPAGLAAGIYATERKLNVLLLEGAVPGGQLMTMYPDKDIYDYLTYPEIKARDLAQKMIAHTQVTAVSLRTGVEVDKIKKETDHFSVAAKDNCFKTRSVILATGLGSFIPRRLQVPGEEELQNRGIFYQTLPERVLGKRIVIVGGGDTALELAVSATEKGASVVVVHRNNVFRALEKTVYKAQSLSIPTFMSAEIAAIHSSEHVENVEIIKNSGTRSFLSADMVSICIGMELRSHLIALLGLETDKQAVKINSRSQTSVEGIFACGDIIVPAGNYKRISVAVGSAASAINGCYQYLKNPYWAA